MTSPTIGVLALQGDVREHLAALAACGADAVPVRRPSELTGLAGIHERHGHFAADAALVHVARLLCGLIRSTDILARTGDAEFGLILDHLDHNSAIDTAERLARCVAEHPLDLGHARVPVKAVVATTGIMPGDKLDDVLARAERNLGSARAQG